MAFSDTNLGMVQGKTEAKIDFDVKEELKKGHFFFRGVQILNAGWQYQTCNIFYRKNALMVVNGFDERLQAGEDTDLGTRVKNLGYSYVFNQSALIYHNVDQISLTSYLKDFKRSQYVPLYFKKHKDLRSKLFWKYFWSRNDFLLIVAIFSVPLGLLASPFIFLLAVPYLLTTFLRFHLVTLRMDRLLALSYRVAMAPFSVLSDIVHFSYSVIGSIRYRCIVI
jgi:GT2 family glycosyltransferase